MTTSKLITRLFPICLWSIFKCQGHFVAKQHSLLPNCLLNMWKRPLLSLATLVQFRKLLEFIMRRPSILNTFWNRFKVAVRYIICMYMPIFTVLLMKHISHKNRFIKETCTAIKSPYISNKQVRNLDNGKTSFGSTNSQSNFHSCC